MELISKALFGIANSLLIPDIILLIFFFLRSLVMVGTTYNAYMVRRKNGRKFDEAIKTLTPSGLASLADKLPKKADSLFTLYLADLLHAGKTPDYADYMLTRFEGEATKDINASQLLTKLGPILGLVGTLISMSPALVGLSSGDITGMAYNMQIVFATTVVGLLISAIGLTTQQLKQRWYAADINNLDYVSRIMAETPEDAAKAKVAAKIAAAAKEAVAASAKEAAATSAKEAASASATAAKEDSL